LKILITSAASAKAYQLKAKLTADQVLLGDYADLPATMLKSGNMIALPNPADASYAHKMLALGLDNGVEAIYALQPAEYQLLAEAELLFEEYGVKLYQPADEI
jgi:hypothetical protein